MVGLLDWHARGQSDVTSAERRRVFGNLRLRRFLQSWEEERQYGWYVVSSLPPHLRAGVLVCGCRFPSFVLTLLSRNLSFIAFLSSHRIKLGFSLFCFYREGHRLPEKLHLVIFIFWLISSTFRYALILCAETPFSILKKVSAPITSGECSRGRKLESLFCVYDKLEELSFGHITIINKNLNCNSTKRKKKSICVCMCVCVICKRIVCR